jgi:hypothetical protein
MTFGRRHKDKLAYSSSARQDARAWGMFIVGAIFVIAALTIDPQKNCNTDRECAPWLVPIAFLMGAAVGLGGLGQLLANPKRGSQIDPESGDLIWWQKRFGASGGDEGRIDPRDISRIRIVKVSDRSDEVHLYDRDGVRQFHFDKEVIGWDQEGWAKAMTERWPHIKVEIVE